MRLLLLCLCASSMLSCAPMPASLRDPGESTWQPVCRVLTRASEV